MYFGDVDRLNTINLVPQEPVVKQGSWDLLELSQPGLRRSRALRAKHYGCGRGRALAAAWGWWKDAHGWDDWIQPWVTDGFLVFQKRASFFFFPLGSSNYISKSHMPLTAILTNNYYVNILCSGLYGSTLTKTHFVFYPVLYFFSLSPNLRINNA